MVASCCHCVDVYFNEIDFYALIFIFMTFSALFILVYVHFHQCAFVSIAFNSRESTTNSAVHCSQRRLEFRSAFHCAMDWIARQIVCNSSYAYVLFSIHSDTHTHCRCSVFGFTPNSSKIPKSNSKRTFLTCYFEWVNERERQNGFCVPYAAEMLYRQSTQNINFQMRALHIFPVSGLSKPEHIRGHQIHSKMHECRVIE